MHDHCILPLASELLCELFICLPITFEDIYILLFLSELTSRLCQLVLLEALLENKNLGNSLGLQTEEV